MSETIDYVEVGFPAIVAGNVRARAARLGVNQTDLAESLDVARSVISMKWRGVRPWKLSDLEDLSEVLQCAPWDLVQPEWSPQRDSNAQPTDYTDGWELAA